MTKNSLTLAVAVAAIASLSAKAQGIIAYDNTSNVERDAGGNILVTGRGNIELGDEINLTTGPTTLTDFSFEYEYSGAGGASGILRMYAKDGGSGLAPGTLLFQSDVFSLQSGFHSASVNNLSLAVPGTLIWTVQFSGLTTPTEGGLLFYNGVGVGNGPGQSLDDYWENSTPGGTPTWVIADNAAPVIDNFGSRAVSVPEPTTVGLLIGGAALLGLSARRRKA